jgi:hypothetical protein
VGSPWGSVGSFRFQVGLSTAWAMEAVSNTTRGYRPLGPVGRGMRSSGTRDQARSPDGTFVEKRPAPGR